MNRSIIGIIILIPLIAALTTLTYHLTQQADMNYYQGHRLFLKGDFRQAIPFFQETLEIDPKKTGAMNKGADNG